MFQTPGLYTRVCAYACWIGRLARDISVGLSQLSYIAILYSIVSLAFFLRSSKLVSQSELFQHFGDNGRPLVTIQDITCWSTLHHFPGGSAPSSLTKILDLTLIFVLVGISPATVVEKLDSAIQASTNPPPLKKIRGGVYTQAIPSG